MCANVLLTIILDSMILTHLLSLSLNMYPWWSIKNQLLTSQHLNDGMIRGFIDVFFSPRKSLLYNYDVNTLVCIAELYDRI